MDFCSFCQLFFQQNQIFILFRFWPVKYGGKRKIEPQDLAKTPQRFKMIAAVNMPSKGITKGNWYIAIPPLCRENTGLTPCNHFGRELVNKLIEHITMSAINVVFLDVV